LSKHITKPAARLVKFLIIRGCRGRGAGLEPMPNLVPADSTLGCRCTKRRAASSTLPKATKPSWNLHIDGILLYNRDVEMNFAQDSGTLSLSLSLSLFALFCFVFPLFSSFPFSCEFKVRIPRLSRNRAARAKSARSRNALLRSFANAIQINRTMFDLRWDRAYHETMDETAELNTWLSLDDRRISSAFSNSTSAWALRNYSARTINNNYEQNISPSIPLASLNEVGQPIHNSCLYARARARVKFINL
jgi:hypothetical protein